MSGTSMDGIEATIIETDGNEFKRTECCSSKKYDSYTLKILNESIKNPLNFINNKEDLKKLNNLVTKEHATVVRKLIKQFDKKVDIIGFHGQTIYHNAEENLSIQIGDGKLLAEITGLNVIFNFRENDINKGGQGAPLAPIYHLSMIKSLNHKLPASILNLGGVGNITWYDGKDLIGFDTGPANGLMDIFTQRKIGSEFDLNGNLASKGIPNFEIINQVLSHNFFKKNYPKSLDRLTFKNVLNNKDFINLSIYDALSTLVYLTVESLKKSISLLPKPPLSLLIVGGGQYNTFLVKNIKKNFNFKVFTSDEIGLNGDMIEAELMAFLAVRSLKKLPLTFPKTTGVQEATSGGCFYKP